MSRRRRAGHEARVLFLALFSGVPALSIAVVLLWTGEHASDVQWSLTALAVGTWLGAALLLKERVTRALRDISNLLGLMREGDFSVRGRMGGRSSDALDQALVEINGLAEMLALQRAGALEASALLGKVMAEIDVAVFAFDGERKLRLVNSAGERLLERPAARIIGTSASDLAMERFLEGAVPRVETTNFVGGGQWELRRSVFRLGGRPHELLVLTDLERTLRAEERHAWQRIVRVLGHEINNSLSPIRSIAQDLQELLGRPVGDESSDWREDVARGLAVIERRSDALARFMAAYARLARLPIPRFAPVDVRSWIKRVVEIETRLPIVLSPGPDIVIAGDSDQLDQMLINLVRNAVEAALETGGAVGVSWEILAKHVEVVVVDEGPGLTETTNLFVPFFTTKPNGSGIGLVLSRQIAEAHSGSLTLESRTDRAGALARVRLRRMA
ncbi:MAG TPA: ATP-binding protein [Polyangiaceae bacterium]|nr:ATP-binding protein [Polyangiaceae bacterium]